VSNPANIFRCPLWIATLLFSLVLSAEGPAQQVDGTKSDEATKSDAGSKAKSDAVRKSVRTELSVQDQQLAMEFAREHHPELFRLLEQLQKSRPAEFSRGVRDLHQQTQNILRSKEKNPQRYESQLAAWKLDSQIRVLTARWTRTKDQSLEKQIRELLAQRQELKKSQLEADEKRLQEQLRRIEEQKAAMAAPLDERVNAEWEQMSRKVTAARKASTEQNKEAGKSP